MRVRSSIHDKEINANDTLACVSSAYWWGADAVDLINGDSGDGAKWSLGRNGQLLLVAVSANLSFTWLLRSGGCNSPTSTFVAWSAKATLSEIHLDL